MAADLGKKKARFCEDPVCFRESGTVKTVSRRSALMLRENEATASQLSRSITMDVMIDNCVVDRFASAGLNPVVALRGTEFVLRYTPDLEREYRQKLHHPSASPEARALAEAILKWGIRVGFFGFEEPYLGFDQGVFAEEDQAQVIGSIKTKQNPKGPIPRNRTDSGLVAFAKDLLGLTDNTTDSHWKEPRSAKGG